MFSRLKRKWANNQTGSVIVGMACSLAALMFVGGVVIDLGGYYVQLSRLQNAADAAATAGVSVNITNGTSRLVQVTDNKDKKGNLICEIDGQEYSFKESDNKKDEADELAEDYVSRNSDISIDKDHVKTRLWDNTSTSTLPNGTEVSFTNAYAYRVDLSDDVELYFSRLIGLDSYPINASAMAVFVTEPDEENIEDFVKKINADIFKTVPNYYWQTIHSNGSYGYFTIKGKTENGVSYSKRDEGWGDKNPEYYTADIINDGKRLSIVKYYDPEDGSVLAWKDGSDPFCAEEIRGTDNVGLKGMRYIVNKDFVDYASKKNNRLKAIFLDRPGLSGDSVVRWTTVEITGDDLGDDEYNESPLFMRFESEGITVNGNNSTSANIHFVQESIVTLSGNQKKPVVIAYDGPDPNRTNDNVPVVATSDFTYNYKQNNKMKSRDIKSGEGLTANFYGFTNTVGTATTQSAPVRLELNGYDFNGVLYAPYSKVIITGGGKIIGFVMAAEIEDNGSGASNRKKVESKEISLPSWGAVYRKDTVTSGKYDRFDYEIKYVKGKYNVVYDEFYNYTQD